MLLTERRIEKRLLVTRELTNHSKEASSHASVDKAASGSKFSVTNPLLRLDLSQARQMIDTINEVNDIPVDGIAEETPSTGSTEFIQIAEGRIPCLPRLEVLAERLYLDAFEKKMVLDYVTLFLSANSFFSDFTFNRKDRLSSCKGFDGFIRSVIE